MQRMETELTPAISSAGCRKTLDTMVANTANSMPPFDTSLLKECAATLHRIANYRLPQALDQRLLWLSEYKESLNGTQRQELAALVDLADDRSLDKVQARAVLERLTRVYPELSGK